MVMTKEQMGNDIHDKMCKYEIGKVIKLIEVWCYETNNDVVPPTPMEDWISFVENHSDKLDWTKISTFNECDDWFYIDSYGLTTTSYIYEEIANASVFFDCRDYWSETYARYQRALSILNGDAFIINEVSPDFYI
jgi:hypothetical protein